MPRASKKPVRRRNNFVYIVAGAVIVAVVVGVGWLLLSANQGATPSASTTTTSKVTSTSATTTTTSKVTSTSATTTTTSKVTSTSTSNTVSNMTSVYARIDTSMGSMEVQLFPSSAPKTVANFVSLAKSGFYNNLVWHRIVAGFVIQAGDPQTRNGGGERSVWGTKGSNQTVPLEIDSSLHNNVGYLGMARTQDPNSGSSQFYINLANNSNLDGGYAVFGKVITGMDVAYTIAKVPVNSASQPITPVFITKITILSQP